MLLSKDRPYSLSAHSTDYTARRTAGFGFRLAANSGSLLGRSRRNGGSICGSSGCCGTWTMALVPIGFATVQDVLHDKLAIPSSLATSSKVANGLPARKASRVSAMARNSSSVSGSSSMGAFVRERATGSSFSARGIVKVWPTRRPLAIAGKCRRELH